MDMRERLLLAYNCFHKLGVTRIFSIHMNV